MTYQITLSRAINFLRIVATYLFSRITRKAVHRGFPVAISIEPNNTCNLRCPECPSGSRELTRHRGNMNLPLFTSIIDQLSPWLTYLTLYFQGEPYLNPLFYDFIQYAKSKKIYVTSSTNGHFLDGENAKKTIESGLDRLIISVDGFNQESYSAYRTGGNLDRVIDGIRLLVDAKRKTQNKTPKIILQCLLLRTNEDQIPAIRKLGHELGVDKITFKTAQFNDFQSGNPLMPLNPRYSRYSRSGSQDSPAYFLKNHQPNACFRMWSGSVFTWDGKVVPCCFDKDASHMLGNISEKSFKEIWRDMPYRSFRQTILKNRKSVDICSNCTQNF